METHKLILEKLDSIQSELNSLKDHMVDVDTVLTEDDIESLQDAEKEFQKNHPRSYELERTGSDSAANDARKLKRFLLD